MPVETILARVISFSSVIIAGLAFRRNTNHDSSDIVTARATLTADVRYIRDSIDEIKLENKSIQKDLSELKTKVVEIEQSTKSAHKRLDDMKKN